MRAQLQDDLIVITFNFNWDLVGLMKSLPAAKFHKSAKLWTVPAIHAEAVVPKLAKAGFSIDPAIQMMADREKQRTSELQQLAGQLGGQFESDLPLLPYQKAGAAFLFKAGSAILGDDVGLGKTIQTLAVIEKSEAHKILVFVPAILKEQWAAEAEKFLDPMKINIQIIDGKPSERARQWTAPLVNVSRTYVIANYELLLRDFEHMSKVNWDYIVADEATRISNARSQTGKAIKKLKAKWKLALTGTPVSNRPNEIWNIVDFISPGAFGKYWQFVEQYCIKDPFWGGITGYQNLDDLAQRLQKFMLRRTKEEVLTELPPKITKEVPFKLSDEEHDLYQKIKKELLFEIEKMDISKLEDPTTLQMTLVKMTRLQQLTDSMELLGEKQISTKLEVLKQVLEETKGRKVIVFTKYAKMADILERELGGHKITGSIPNPERQPILDEFARDDKQLLIMTNAGAHGLNIQAASVIVHFDQEWSLGKMTQREGRAHRMGQKQSVLVYNLLAKGTIDMYVNKVLQAKKQLSDAITMADIKEILEYGE